MVYESLKDYREKMLRGYALAFPEYIIEVPGGVVRTTETPREKVAVINGGGSGHYPAFYGIVGPGFMDGTVVGNIFSSPSSDEVYAVAKAVENGSGVFIIGGNYAGDKMNFNVARDKLNAEGIESRTFYITDDIASANKEEREKRRGNVGTFFVFKVAGAASAMGCSLNEIERLTVHANDMTRTISAGFRGCSMPGCTEPMFHVPEGRMEMGQGIHGEPGVYESDLVTPEKLAEIFVDMLVAEKPEGADSRIGVILDGLGSTKYEELFVLWGSIYTLLTQKGYTIVSPQVGELVTSMNMEGVALSIMWLDDELEKCWLAPADTPAFRIGEAKRTHEEKRILKQEQESYVLEEASDESKKLALDVLKGLQNAKNTIILEEENLGKMDAIAGDGDHGRGMVKGISNAYIAAESACECGAGLGSMLEIAGKEWAAKAGGTSGILWGSALETVGKVIGNQLGLLTVEKIAEATEAALKKMIEMGGASRGDKTMLDTLIPVVESLGNSVENGDEVEEAWLKAAREAEKAAKDTAALIPKVGRARPQAERSLGTPDPGAISMAMIIKAFCK